MNRLRWVVGMAMAVAAAVVTWNPPSTGFRTPAPVAVATGATPGVSAPWALGRPQLGIHVYWEDNPADDLAAIRAKARRLVDQVIGLEANSMAVSFPFFAGSITSSEVLVDERTPSPDRIGILVDEAGRSGLRTTIRPLLDQTNLAEVDPDDWRGVFAPADRDAWYASYREFLTPYLVTAERLGVDTVAIAAELTAMQADPHWASLVEYARDVYLGELTYSSNWDAYPGAVARIPVDRVDIDAYPLLGLEPEANEQEMTTAWRDWLVRTAGDTTNVVLSEVGAAAERFMQYNPSRPHTPGSPLDEDIQRRWFTAACQSARDRGLAGLYWWKIDLYVDPALADPDTDLHDSFLGRPAERTVRECFTAWGAEP